MLTEDQKYLNIFDVETKNKQYKYYRFCLDEDETFNKSDMDLYGIDGLLTYGNGEWLDLGRLTEFSQIRALSLHPDQWFTSVNSLQAFRKLEHFEGPNLCDAVIPFDGFRKLYSADVNYIMADMEESLEVGEEEEGKEDLSPAGYTVQDIQAFGSIINSFLKEIEQSKEYKKHIFCITKKTVLQLNQLNSSCGGELMETEQRENIVTLLLDVMESAGIEVTDDITLEWRKW